MVVKVAEPALTPELTHISLGLIASEPTLPLYGEEKQMPENKGCSLNYVPTLNYQLNWRGTTQGPRPGAQLPHMVETKTNDSAFLLC